MSTEPNRIEQTYRRLTAEHRSIVKLYSGNPTEHGLYFPTDILTEAYLHALQDPLYQPEPKGLSVARQAISDYYATYGVDVSPEYIILNSGTSESFFYLFTLLAQPGDNILVPNPAYPLFDHIAKLARIELRQYPLREDQDWKIDLEALRRQANDRTRALLLISPHNPTGAVTSAEQIEEIVAWANRRELPLICDEVFSEFYFGPGPYPRPMAMSQPNLCFTLNGVSKMFALPQLKLGWIAVSGKKSLLLSAVDELETTADTFLSSHTPIQKALPALMEQGRAFCEAYRSEVRKRRDIAVNILSQSDDVSFVVPRGGFYLMLQVRKPLPVSEEDFVIELMESTDLFVHPGYFYDYGSGIHCVVSYLSKTQQLESHLKMILEFIESF